MKCRLRGSLAMVFVFLAVIGSRATYAQPDVITGYVGSVDQLGRVGPIGAGTVGLGMWTTSCNIGNAAANWDELPSVDHPVICLNFYRLSSIGGADRFEQIGQAWLKHGFGSSNSTECGIPGCFGGPFNRLTPNCSDTYAAGQINPCGGGTMGIMAPRSVMHPYTGQMAASSHLGGGSCPNNFASANHLGHIHDPISHRLQVKDVDLDPALNPGAQYFGEGHYLVPHEFRSGNGNQNNNVSHQEIGVFGPDGSGEFGFFDQSGVFVSVPAVDSWPGAQQSRIEPSPMNDGRATLAYKVTPLGGGTWHYEYAIHNMNLDTSIAKFIVPVPAGVTISNVGFRAPLHHAPELHADNYSNAAWTSSTAGGAVSWSTTPHAIDPLANAVRFGTLYNFRFDATTPPRRVQSTVGLFKNGLDMAVATLAPRAPGPLDCNGNTIEDTCDLSCAGPCSIPGCGTKIDCDGTGVPDECEIDCNGNNRGDQCDIDLGASDDCSGNGVPDECESTCGGSPTVNSCRLLAGSPDCNINGIPDSCDIADGTSDDTNSDGRPDECALLCPASSPAVAETIANANLQQVTSAKNRYLSFRAGDPGRIQAVQLEFTSLPPPWDVRNGIRMWVDIPTAVCELSGTGIGEPCTPPATSSNMATLSCEPIYVDWASRGVVHVYHESIVPGGVYQLRVIDLGCSPGDDGSFSTSIGITNSIWGNVSGPFSVPIQMFTAPESPSSVDITVDVVAVLGKFRNQANAPVKSRADVEPSFVDQKISINDVMQVLEAFRSRPYPFSPGPAPCS